MSKPIAFNYADYTDLITENDEKAIMLHVSDKVISKQKKEIESLQAQLAEKIHIKLRTDEDMLTPAEAIETINRLRKAYRKTTAQLIESQCREKAAVECLEEVEYSLANSRFSAAWVAICKWRGTQGAGEGESNA